LPRYHFILQPDELEDKDDEGAILPNEQVAREYAVRIVTELQRSNYSGPALALRVIDEAGREIAVIPFESSSGSLH
jgi:hypothetical protein